VTSAEFQILETVFLIVVASLLLLALPGYAWLRLSAQKSKEAQGGDTPSSVIQPLDLIIVGFYILVFTVSLKGAESKMENLEELQMTAGLVLVSSIAMLSIARHCSIDTFLAHQPYRVFWPSLATLEKYFLDHARPLFLR
jgi:hypothetical protein